MTLRVVFAVGTHEQPFQRLLDVAYISSASVELEMRVQYGVGTFRSSCCVENAAYITGSKMQEWLEWSDILVSQASPGFVFSALSAGSWPIVLPRNASFKEHVDNHQARFAELAAEAALATRAESVADLSNLISAEARLPQGDRRSRVDKAWSGSERRTAIFRARFGQLLDELSAS